MEQPADTNAAIWKSDAIVENWVAESADRERRRVAHREVMAALLPFAVDQEFTFVDLGAGTGAASQTILRRYPNSTAILADFSAPMMAGAQQQLAEYAGRFSYVEFDLNSSDWSSLPASVDAVITSLSIHHLPDERKAGLFGEIREHLIPNGWYLNYDPVTAPDPDVEAAWTRVGDRLDPEAAHKRTHRSHEEQARYENHVRYMIPLDQQLTYLRQAGFAAVDVYWKQLDHVICGGHRPA